MIPYGILAKPLTRWGYEYTYMSTQKNIKKKISISKEYHKQVFVLFQFIMFVLFRSSSYSTIPLLLNFLVPCSTLICKFIEYILSTLVCSLLWFYLKVFFSIMVYGSWYTYPKETVHKKNCTADAADSWVGDT